jgi:hypothetical protein
MTEITLAGRSRLISPWNTCQWEPSLASTDAGRFIDGLMCVTSCDKISNNRTRLDSTFFLKRQRNSSNVLIPIQLSVEEKETLNHYTVTAVAYCTALYCTASKSISQNRLIYISCIFAMTLIEDGCEEECNEQTEHRLTLIKIQHQCRQENNSTLLLCRAYTSSNQLLCLV